MRAPLALAAAITLLTGLEAQAQPGRWEAPPPGSYQRTCRNIDVRGYGQDAMLVADCRDGYGRWRTSTLRFGECRDDVQNIDGRLYCRQERPRPPGSGYGSGWGQGRGGSITLFSGPDYRGPAFSTAREFSNLPRQDNDKALSLRVERGAWEVCSDANFSGRCQVFSRDVPDLRAYGLGEAISSIRPAQQDGWQGDRYGRGGEITLYYGPGFRGPSFSATRELSNLPRQDNDKALSLRIERGAWEVCSNSDFGGRCQVFTHDVPDLRDYGLGEAISSIRPVR